MNTLVHLQNVSKTYTRGVQKVEVLHGINLDIAAGDFVALMGPSGSGKTTLLNLIGGLDAPSGGSIDVGGARIDQLSENALAKWRSAHVGFVFQFYNLLATLSARRNVELPLLLTRLSGARAIVSDPALLVCDEPTGDLDRQSAAEVLTLLQQLNRDHGKTVIMVTHDPKAAEFARHTVFLDKGTLADASARPAA